MLQVLRANPAAGEHMKKRLWPDSTPSRGSTTSSGTGLATRWGSPTPSSTPTPACGRSRSSASSGPTRSTRGVRIRL